jgi:hypothetical protein
MPKVHEAIGFVVVAVFTVGWIWGAGALILKRDPGERYWTWITVEQVLAGGQAAIGVLLLVLGYRPDTSLHYVYGFGPLVIFAIGHLLAREEAFRTKPWAPFALASFISFGLSLRALTTGLGIG